MISFNYYYINYIKHLLDIVIAFVALLLLSPLFVIVVILILLDSGRPVVFKQKRIGKNGVIFDIYKFRTMINNNLKIGNTMLTENDDRITRIGKLLRKSSIDELPQIINIIKGDMSFIGPRPPLTYYPKTYDDYSNYEKKRFQVKPGISGLAQLRCREIHDWNVNIPIDVEYVENISYKLDTKLFVKSLFVFFKTDNIYSK